MKQLGSVILPEETVWLNQFNYAPVRQSVNRTVSGTVVYTTQKLYGGRPINLELEQGFAWLDYSAVSELMQLAEIPGRTMSLNWEDIFYVVLFDHSATPYEFKPLVGYNKVDQDFYYGVINLITV
ncbi:MAG: hypothetical protein BWK78_00440 [Thiotrichaceae bacterium IS1]|nr:MAG: hypothetical protein BWK78_00440 [Thiotrichaceae bacterium IS1]